MSNLPHPLHVLIQSYHAETQGFRKVHRLIDAFEWAIKWHTTVVMSDLLTNQQEYSDELKVLLSAGLYTPSLGVWVFFLRELLDKNHLQSPRQPWNQWQNLITIENKKHIVNFRNGYAHGATPPDEKCLADCNKWFPVLEQIIASPFFQNIRMVVGVDENIGAHIWNNDERISCNAKIAPGKVGIVLTDDPDTLLFPLWPLGMLDSDPDVINHQREQDPSHDRRPLFFYFNAIRNQKLEKLNYEFSLMLRDKGLWQDFSEQLPLDEWKKIRNPDLDLFRERIEVLTNVFKGRVQERQAVRDFCQRTESGSLMIWGPPGIGKSALLAQSFKEIRSGLDLDGHTLEGTFKHVVPYFIRRGEETALPERFLRHLCREMDRHYKLKGFSFGTTTLELRDALSARITAISDNKESNDKHLVLFVDGLDEALRDGNTILQYIPDSNRWLSVICASRDVPEIKKWFFDWKNGQTNEMTVSKISQEDIRAMLYDVINKYDHNFTQAYIDEIRVKSQGNPLYVRLLCDELFHGTQQVGNTKGLPKDLNTMYRQIIDRITENGDNQEIYDLLILFTESKESLEIDFIRDFFDLNMPKSKHLLESILELLYTKEQEQGNSYLFFHESLREYIRKTDNRACGTMQHRLADFCFDWQHLHPNSSARTYALTFAGPHLKDVDDGERLWTLIQDQPYQRAQVERSLQYNDTYTLLENGLEWYASQNTYTSEMNVRLAQIVMICGSIAQQAKQDVSKAIQWFKDDPERLYDTLQRLDVLDERQYFTACILLIWIEVERQHQMNATERSSLRIEKVLQAIEERIPEGTGTIDWSDFLSVHFMAFWLHRIIEIFVDIDMSVIYRRFDHCASFVDACLELIESDETPPVQFIEQCLEVARIYKSSAAQKSIAVAIAKCSDCTRALEIAEFIDDNVDKGRALLEITKTLININKIEQADSILQKAINIAELIEDKYLKSIVLSEIPTTLININKIEQADSILQQTINITESIKDEWAKVNVLLEVATTLISINKIEQADSILQQTINIAELIEERSIKLEVLSKIATKLVKINKVEQAINIAESIKDEWDKVDVLLEVATTLISINKIEQADSILQQTINIAESIKDEYLKSIVLSEIATTLININKIEQAINIAESIEDKYRDSKVLLEVATTLISINKIEQADSILQQTINIAESIKDEYRKSEVLSEIVTTLAKLNKVEQAINISESIEDKHLKSIVLSEIATILAKFDKVEQADSILQKAINISGSIKRERVKSLVLLEIVTTLISINKIEQADSILQQAINIDESIKDKHLKSIALSKVAATLININKIEQADSILQQTINIAESIKENEWNKSEVLSEIVTNLVKINKVEQAINIAESIEDKHLKSIVLLEIVRTLAKLNKVEQAINIAESIEDKHLKSIALSKVAATLININKIEQADSILQQTINIAESIKDEWAKVNVLLEVATTLISINKIEQADSIFQKAINIAKSIEYKPLKLIALSKVAATLININKIEQADSILQKAINIAESIEDKHLKSIVLLEIASTLVKFNDIEQAIKITISNPYDSDKAAAINKISKTITSKDSNQSHLRNILHQHLLHTEYSNVFYQNLMKEYPSTLNTLSDLRNALLYFPFDQNAAYACMYRFIELLYQDGQMDCAHAIIRAIPDLDLEVLLPDETEITPTYANVAQWLHLVEDEDDLDDIKAWVTRVRDGKRDAAWFDTRVKDVALLQSVERTYDNLSAWIDAIEDEDLRDDITSWAERVKNGRKDAAWFNARIKDVFDSY